MTSIEHRLKIVMSGMSVRKFAERLGTPATTLQQYLKGRIPPSDFIVLVCERCGIDSWWLLTGEGDMKQARPIMVSDKPEGFKNKKVLVAPTTQPIVVTENRKEDVLIQKLQRVLNEGDKTKVDAVKSMLKAFDPGEKKQGVDCAENEGVGTVHNRAA